MSVAAVEAVPGIVWEAELEDAPVAVHAAGGLIAVGGADGECRVYDATTGEIRASASLEGGLLHVAVSPDGARVALAGPFGHGVLTLGQDFRATSTGAWSSRVAWADPDRVAIASGRRVLVLDGAGEELWSTDPAPSTVTDLGWQRDGRRLATTAYNGVRSYEQHSSAPIATYDYLGSHLALAISSTGRWICSGNQDASIHIWRTKDGRDLTMHGYPEKVSRIAFDPSGRWLAADGAPDITIWDFSGKGPEGRYPRALTGHVTITTFAWRPGDSRILASAGAEGMLALWHAEDGKPGEEVKPRIARGMAQPVLALAWAGPDHLAHVGVDGHIEVWRPLA